MILLYALGREQDKRPQITLPPGVQETVVEQAAQGAVAAFYSTLDTLPTEAAAIQRAALDFFAVQQSLFAEATIVPFRFPAIVADAAALRAFLETHRQRALADLEHLAGRAQVKILVAGPHHHNQVQPPEPHSAASPKPAPAPASGGDYLRQRKQEADALGDFARRIEDAAGAAAEWKKREQRNRLQMYALVPRGQVAGLVAQAKVAAEASGASVTTSGPWPPSEFVSAYSSGERAAEPEKEKENEKE